MIINPQMTQNQALKCAIAYVEIKNDEPVCTSSSFADGLYHFIVTTLYLRYEFYVDAMNGEVLGISTEPLLDLEELNLSMDPEEMRRIA